MGDMGRGEPKQLLNKAMLPIIFKKIIVLQQWRTAEDFSERAPLRRALYVIFSQYA